MNRSLYVMMGVSGSGKSTIGAAFARALAIPFVEGDEYHPVENVKRMALGIPLTDADRVPWLHAIGRRLREARDTGTGLVMSCSALKRSYRDILRAEAGRGGGSGGSGGGELQFIFLKGERAVIAERMAGRRGHFMPPALLDSQFATLEEPTPDEHAWVCDVRDAPEKIVAALVARATA